MTFHFLLSLLSIIGPMMTSPSSQAAAITTPTVSREAQPLCTDNPSFTFRVNSKEEEKISVGCDYIKEDAISNNDLVKRYNRFCTDAFNRNYSTECPKSCGLCVGDNDNDFDDVNEYSYHDNYGMLAATTTNNAEICEDEMNYKFIAVDTNTNILLVVPCSWIAELGLSDDELFTRYNRYCRNNPACCGSCLSALIRLGEDETSSSPSTTNSPTTHPTTSLTIHATSTQPTTQPIASLNTQPTMQPVMKPTTHPTTQLTTQPTVQPTMQLTSQLTTQQTQDYFCSDTNAASLYGKTLHFSTMDPTDDNQRKCFKVEVFENGKFLADSTDPYCHQTNLFQITDEYSMFRTKQKQMNKPNKIIFKAMNFMYPYRGRFILRPNKKNNDFVTTIRLWNTKRFKIILKIPPCV